MSWWGVARSKARCLTKGMGLLSAELALGVAMRMRSRELLAAETLPQYLLSGEARRTYAVVLQ
jgi:hypothetical protein